MLRSLKSLILGWLKPLQILLQHIGRDETLITEAIVSYIQGIIEPGDILLSHEDQRITGLLINGFFKHAAIITNHLTVMEAVGDNYVDGKNAGGVREVPLEEWLFKKDYVSVIRTTYPVELRTGAGANAYKYKGLNYDYSFSLKAAQVYCSELVYLCYTTENKSFLKEIKPDENQIYPQVYFDLTKKTDYLKLIYNSKET